MESATVYLYSPGGGNPGIYVNATDIVTRLVPVGAIEFKDNRGFRVVSTLPYIVIWNR